MFITLVMLSNPLILSHPLLLWLPIFPSIRVFSKESASGGQSIGDSASASVLPVTIQDWFPLGLTGLISYASKFRKLSSGHRTRKGQFSFQSQRKTMPKNVQTTTQSHSFRTLAKQYSKFSKLGFNSMWTKNFQVFKLDLEKAEERENKLPASTGSLKKQENSRKTSTSASLTTFVDNKLENS